MNTYFEPSISIIKVRKVLWPLNKHIFGDIKLIMYIIDIKLSLEQVISL